MKIYNSKTRQKETFVPLREGRVHIYLCGPTVYNYFHIGNARPFIVFDVLRRYLDYLGYEVVFVQNFTDIDDKMIRRANEEGITVKELGDRFIKEYFVDADSLGIQRATHHPRATEHIPEIIALISKLIENGKAYQVGSDVYFSVSDFDHYGCLCQQNLEDLESGARIDIDSNKKNPLDFVLWKGQKAGEPAWESPFGFGRPGWHIECSAMSMKYLGSTIDIHCGGKDLLFPHHENETAQSEAATGQTFVNYWMHNGFINIDNEKMSKSAGNFFTVRDISQKYDLEILRMFMLLVHYRSPINFSPALMEQAESSLSRLYNARNHLDFYIEHTKQAHQCTESADAQLRESLQRARSGFEEAMNDDLNTADAISHLFELARDIFTYAEHVESAEILKDTKMTMLRLAKILGLLQKDKDNLPAKVEQLLALRADARKNKEWKTSDALREQIKSLGYAVEDTASGQKVSKLQS